MENAVQMVPVVKDDLQQWLAFSHALWPNCSKQYLLQEYADGLHPFPFLCLMEGEAVGMLDLSLRRDYVQGTHTSPVGYIEGIYVAPQHRGRGVGKAMVAFAKGWAKRQGCRALGSDCEVQNTQSAAFHRAAGFADAGTIVCFAMELEGDGIQ